MTKPTANIAKRSYLNHLFRQAVTFGLVGVVNTLVGLAVFYGFLFVVGAPPGMSNVIGHCVAVCVSSLLNSKFTFNQRPSVKRAIQFLFCFGFSLAVNLAVLHGGIAMGLSPGFAQFPAMVAYTAVFFLSTRFLVFK